MMTIVEKTVFGVEYISPWQRRAIWCFPRLDLYILSQIMSVNRTSRFALHIRRVGSGSDNRTWPDSVTNPSPERFFGSYHGVANFVQAFRNRLRAIVTLPKQGTVIGIDGHACILFAGIVGESSEDFVKFAHFFCEWPSTFDQHEPSFAGQLHSCSKCYSSDWKRYMSCFYFLSINKFYNANPLSINFFLASFIFQI